jgi:hypothetical protein
MAESRWPRKPFKYPFLDRIHVHETGAYATTPPEDPSSLVVPVQQLLEFFFSEDISKRAVAEVRFDHNSPLGISARMRFLKDSRP